MAHGAAASIRCSASSRTRLALADARRRHPSHRADQHRERDVQPSEPPPPGLPLHPDIVVEDDRRPTRWLLWAGLTLLAAVIASLGDRLVGRILVAFEDRPPLRTLPPPPAR